MNFSVDEPILAIVDNVVHEAVVVKVNQKTVKIRIIDHWTNNRTQNVHACRLKRYNDNTVCLGLLTNFSLRWYDGEDMKGFRQPAKDWQRSVLYPGMDSKCIVPIFAKPRKENKNFADVFHPSLGPQNNLQISLKNHFWK